jgi:hypothetical protein
MHSAVRTFHLATFFLFFSFGNFFFFLASCCNV